MQILHDLWQTTLHEPTFVTIGNFDGVHRGHQALLAAVISAARAAGCRAGALTFNPHPREVLRPNEVVLNLTTLDERLALLETTGLDFVVIQPFTQDTAEITATEFAQQMAQRLQLRALWVGPDFALGHKRQGTVPELQKLGEIFGFAVQTITPVALNGAEVRSGAIRAALLAGNVALAAQWLGRPHALAGEVVRGDQRGATIGFPTANLAVPPQRLVPANGVYATWAHVQNERYASVTNVGVRPTFNGQTRSIETHLFDFSGDLYGQQVRIEFVERLRGEQRFANVEALVAQIRHDAKIAREHLAK